MKSYINTYSPVDIIYISTKEYNLTDSSSEIICCSKLTLKLKLTCETSISNPI